MRQLESRDDFPALLTELGLTGYAVEVGTQEGVFAEHIFKHWPGILCTVDPWKFQPDWTFDQANVGQEEQDRRFAATLERLTPFGDRWWLFRLPSWAAAKMLPLRAPQVDFVYLDARHDAPHIQNDIDAWWPLVKPGGILAGHDYAKHLDFAVIEAVDAFVQRENLTLHLTQEQHFPSWYVQKPTA